jgi:UDP-N-acetylmuramoyl-tripeptide--D-alanyl-D-alanine ligase
MSLWTTEALRAATKGSLAGAAPVTGISIDTRTLAPGDLFVALRDLRDGHDFVAETLAAGAAAAMVDRDLPGLPADAPLLRVADTLAGLIALGKAGRARCAGRVAAITGSVGKTGTKEMLRLLLGSIGPTHAAIASYNNHWGVPLTLARMPAGSAFAVIEIGMNNPGEILPLARLAAPHAAAVTMIGEAHIGHMGGLEAVADEKGSIAAGLVSGGTAVLPRDSAFFDRLSAIARAAGAARIIGFGRHRDADIRLAEASILRDGRTRAMVAIRGRLVEVTMPAMGLHHAENACCALALVEALGQDAARAAPALLAYAPGAGRGAPRTIAVAGGTALLIDESYNAAPPAMRAALQTLALRPGARRIAVLGDMRELGEFSAALHAGLATEAGKADLVFCCGPEMARLYALLPAARRGAQAADSAALAPLVRDALRPGDVVLVKGALGSRMALVVRALTELPT